MDHDGYIWIHLRCQVLHLRYQVQWIKENGEWIILRERFDVQLPMSKLVGDATTEGGGAIGAGFQILTQKVGEIQYVVRSGCLVSL